MDIESIRGVLESVGLLFLSPLCIFAASRQGVVPLAGRRPLREISLLFFSVSPGSPGFNSLLLRRTYQFGCGIAALDRSPFGQ